MTHPRDDGQGDLVARLCEQARRLASGDDRLSHVVVRVGDVHVELERAAAGEVSPAITPRPAPAPEPEGEGDDHGHLVTAPVVGTFYRAPEPGQPPFVEVGDAVEEDSVVGIVEAMKLMNRVSAGCRGVVAAVLVADATAVEYGQPLVEVALAPDSDGQSRTTTATRDVS